MSKNDDHKQRTKLVHIGRSPTKFGGAVNPPIQRASTLLAADMKNLYGGPKSLYGRMGVGVHDTLKEALCVLENAKNCTLTPNGLSSCSLAMASLVKAGDHIIVSDSVYGPTRRFCLSYLKRMGVETTFISPRITGPQLEATIQSNTALIFLEMPGSLTFELHDLDAIVAIAKANDIPTALDNTWGAGIFFKPLDHGVDISTQALTKYVIGHSDGFGGAVLCNSHDIAKKMTQTADDWGLSMSPDDAYLAQRGIRSLELRMTHQGASGLTVAEFLKNHPRVQKLHHPACAGHPDHDKWQHYYSGTAGLFSFEVDAQFSDQLDHFYEALTLFGFGFSWGGFESLLIPCDPQLRRDASPEWKQKTRGPLMRINIGLEDPSDLIADLDSALNAMVS